MTAGSTGPGIVAVLSPEGESRDDYFLAVQHGEGTPVAVDPDDEFPHAAGALLAIGSGPFRGESPHILDVALEQGIPVLGVGWGMHAVNVALGGGLAVPVPDDAGEAAKMPVFISPGAKLSYTITGSGWVSVSFDNTEGLRATELAPNLMASCYREDGFIAAFEVPGNNWTIGVQWNAHQINAMPSGFDNLLLALVERAAGIQ